MVAPAYNGPESELTGKIIKLAIEVHRHFGCGLKEEAYEAALCWELRQAGLKVERQKPCPVIYKGVDLSDENERPRRIDILVEDKVVVECKALPSNEYIFKAQCLTYLLDGAQAHLQNTPRVSETSPFSVLAPQAPSRGELQGGYDEL